MLNNLRALKAYLDRIGARIVSPRRAVIAEPAQGGYSREVASIRWDSNGIIRAPAHLAPREEEQLRIVEEFRAADVPHSMPFTDLPAEFAGLTSGRDYFIVRDEAGQPQFVLRRIEHSKGKSYIPYSYWSDGQWRKAEPSEQLPLYGIEHARGHSTAFIHEGVKAAHRMIELVRRWKRGDETVERECPWIDHLALGVHLGYLGGAYNVHRTDWAALRRAGITKVYIIADNDMPGRQAVPQIAKAVGLECWHVDFTDEWPAAWDMGDPWPEHMFAEGRSGKRIYVGPSMAEVLRPATWATKEVGRSGKKPQYAISPAFAAQWAHVVEPEIAVHVDDPRWRFTRSEFNQFVRPFSDVEDVWKLLVSQYHNATATICYEPNVNERRLMRGNRPAINVYRPGLIPANDLDCGPWLEFMEYLIPPEEDREYLLKWCATLLAKPEIRIPFGVLLVSTLHGTGKTTLTDSILAPLVGIHNCSWPAEQDIVESQFNGWAAMRRLVIVAEIYMGKSWTAYHRLKSLITDRQLRVNEKFMKPYVLDNWAHIIASSNSMEALKIEVHDRRWLVPRVTEERWAQERFAEFHRWLRQGGLGAIQRWAYEYGDYYTESDTAPMTLRKRAMQEGSLGEAEVMAIDLAKAIADMDKPVALLSNDILEWLNDMVNHSEPVQWRRIVAAMRVANVEPAATRHTFNGRAQIVMLNRAGQELYEQLRTQLPRHSRKLTQRLAKIIRTPAQIMEER